MGASASAIPDKLYFRIGEVARLCHLPASVLRFWESEFPQLKPHKGGTGQRLYRRRDVEMVLRVRSLLREEGYTIPGARQMLKSEPIFSEPTPPVPSPPDSICTEESSSESPLSRAASLSSSPPVLPGIATRSDLNPLSILRCELEDLSALLAQPVGTPPAFNPSRFSQSSPRPTPPTVAPPAIKSLPAEALLAPAARAAKRSRPGPSLIGSLFDQTGSLFDAAESPENEK